MPNETVSHEEIAPVPVNSAVKDYESKTSELSHHAVPAIYQEGRDLSATWPQQTSLPQQPRSKGKVRRFFSVFVRSLGNSLDDNTFRHWRSNSTYQQHFLNSTWCAYRSLLTRDDSDTLHVSWIDDAEVPFRSVVTQLDGGISIVAIEHAFRSVLVCLAIATIALIYTFFCALDAVFFWFLLDQTTFVDGLNVATQVSYCLFAVFIYLYYGYHSWVFRRDKFGTFRSYLQALCKFNLEAIFPYCDLSRFEH
ncbi:hypothetical protein QTV44_002606 [Vibrio vulnificus]|nr:hypothetical protein [Vibrio vulnificus]